MKIDSPRRLARWSALVLVASAPFACTFNSEGLAPGGGTPGSSSSSGSGGSEPACAPGEIVECYTGASETRNKGACRAGTKTCNGDGAGFGPCVGEVLPAAEDCATPLDEDCDGEVNDLCPCTAGATEPCYSGPNGTENVGPCKGGMHTCNPDGMGYGPCMGEVVPAPTEDCATPVDDDCDGAAFGAPGSSCQCEIGTSTPCNTGGQGVCGDGAQACSGDASASSYGSCTQTTQASTEDCATAADESCDGAGDCTGGAITGNKVGVANKDDVAYAVAFDKSGNFVAGGVTNGAVTGLDVSEGSLWLAKYKASGTVDWEKAIAPGGTGPYAVVYGLATDGAGNVYAAGEFKGTLDFGGGVTIASANGAASIDAFLVKLNAGGAAQWAKALGGSFRQFASGVAVDGQGHVIIVGGMEDDTDFGGGLLNCEGSYDVFVAKYDASGVHKWSKNAGDGGYQVAWGVAAAPNDDVVIVGEAAAHLNFGDDFDGDGGGDAFVVRLDTDGVHLWTKNFGDGETQAAFGVAVDAQGDVVITGGFESNINFGPGNVSGATDDNSTMDVFVAKLNGGDGTHLWSKAFGGANTQYGNRVAVDGLGNVVVIGSFLGTIDFGGGGLTSANAATYDVFVAKLKAGDGGHVWSKSHGDAGDQRGWDVAVDALGNVAIAGGFEGTTDFGLPGGPLTSLGAHDIFAVKLAP